MSKVILESTPGERAYEAAIKYLSPAHYARLKNAETIMREAHKDDTRRNGDPYFLHPLEVATKSARANHPVHVIEAALLHDVVEDHAVHGFTMKFLEESGVSEEARLLVNYLTHDRAYTYEDYIGTICQSFWACVLKVIDIGCNITPETTAERLELYSHALLRIAKAQETLPA